MWLLSSTRNMHSFYIKYTIFLLLGLSQKFASAKVDNVANEKTTAAKVFANFLKVPWINLNSSWENEVSPTCRNDTASLFRSADAGEMWALQMLDAASKIPTGILYGNIRDLGVYDECVGSKGHADSSNIQGRHCMVSLSMPHEFAGDSSRALYVQRLSMYNPSEDVALSLTTSMCLPSSCDTEDVRSFVNASIRGTPTLAKFDVRVVQVTCSSVEGETEGFTLGTILAISFFATVGILLMFSTCCDFVVRARPDNASRTLKKIATFSLYTNTIKLSSTKVNPENMPAIHGIRFLSMCLIVTVHRLLSTLVKPIVNLSDIYTLRHSWLATFVLTLPYAVDTFFVISGFLMAYLFLTKMRSGVKFNILKLYLHRYVRLAPCMAVLILFDIFLLPHLGSGPIWEMILGVTSGFCRKNWWTNLLYIQNFVNQYEMCMPHTWYLAVEMQLFWISPIFLFPLFRRPKLGLSMLTVVLIVSLITPVIEILINQYSFLFNMTRNFRVRYKEFFDFYTITYNRALPYFVGILLGYYVANNKRKCTKAQVAFAWICTCVVVAFCFWSTAFVQPNAILYNAGWEAAYVSFGRLGWSLAIAWILYACTQGYGGPVTRFLSLPMFVPLSRISYCIYLVSLVIQVGLNSMMRTAEFDSTLRVLYIIWSDLAVSIGAAFILTLCFESPVIALEKIWKVQQPSTVICASSRKKEKLLAMVREYLEITRGRASSDVEIEAKLSQPDFWWTVSDTLNSLGRMETKSPAEWLKTWQDWRSDLLKSDSERKYWAKGIQNGSARCQTGLTTLEREFLIFLAAVSCGLNDVESSKNNESEFAGSARCHSGSCCLQHENFDRSSTLNSTTFAEKMSKFSGPTSAGNKVTNRNIDSLP